MEMYLVDSLFNKKKNHFGKPVDALQLFDHPLQ